MNIESASKEFIEKLLDSDPYEPRGKFIMLDEVDGKSVWVAVDNHSGDAFTEEFYNANDAMDYLSGNRVMNRFGEVVG